MFEQTELCVPYSVPGQPTDAPPGTEKKILVMIERAGRREALFHPQDGICKKPHLNLPQILQTLRSAGAESA